MAEPPTTAIAGAISRLSPKHRQYLILGLGASSFRAAGVRWRGHLGQAGSTTPGNAAGPSATHADQRAWCSGRSA